MIVSVAQFEEIVKYLEGNVLPEDRIRFKRGIVYSDGRLDLCKQGLGAALPMITKALEKNDKIQHFLIGNDVVGRSGSEAIGQMVSERSPETLYLAGNELDGEGVRILLAAANYDRKIKELWLKRNPLYADGAFHISRYLSSPLSTSLSVLDLDNVGLFDDGVEVLMSGLMQNASLQTLYLSANGITENGASYIARYFSAHPSDGISNLYMSVNRIADQGAEVLAESLKNNVNLERLCLESNRIEAEGAKALCLALIHHPRLSYFSLGFAKATSDLGELPNRLRDRGVAAVCRLIARAPALRVACVGRNAITRKGADALATACLKSDSILHVEIVEKFLSVDDDLRKEMFQHLDDNRIRFFGQEISRSDFMDKEMRFMRSDRSVVNVDSQYRNEMFMANLMCRKRKMKV